VTVWQALLVTLMLPGQVRLGACVSFTVTVNWQVAEPAVLLAVQMTVLTPTGNA